MVYAVIDEAGLVVNMVEWNGTDGWAPPEGQSAVPVEDVAGIGWTYQDGIFVQPPEPETLAAEPGV